jgi:hypothetical protein
MAMKTVKIELGERNHRTLVGDANKNFRTIKATVEMIVQQYLDKNYPQPNPPRELINRYSPAEELKK